MLVLRQFEARTVLLATLVLSCGCTLDHSWTHKDATPAAGKPSQMAVAWINKVQYAPDVVHDGNPTPGLVGRLYLFDDEVKFPVAGDGAVTVTLYDDTKGPATQPLEQWYIDPVALKKFLKKDTVGWGYTVFLPWGSCKPDVTKVHLMCKYESASGQAIMGPVSPLSLEHDRPPAGTAPAPAPLPQLPMPAPVK
jgi:hypothetical protein